jgi:hypothetical protein
MFDRIRDTRGKFYDALLVGFIRTILWTRGLRVEIVKEGETETMVISPRSPPQDGTR